MVIWWRRTTFCTMEKNLVLLYVHVCMVTSLFRLWFDLIWWSWWMWSKCIFDKMINIHLDIPCLPFNCLVHHIVGETLSVFVLTIIWMHKRWLFHLINCLGLTEINKNFPFKKMTSGCTVWKKGLVLPWNSGFCLFHTYSFCVRPTLFDFWGLCFSFPSQNDYR